MRKKKKLLLLATSVSIMAKLNHYITNEQLFIIYCIQYSLLYAYRVISDVSSRDRLFL